MVKKVPKAVVKTQEKLSNGYGKQKTKKEVLVNIETERLANMESDEADNSEVAQNEMEELRPQNPEEVSGSNKDSSKSRKRKIIPVENKDTRKARTKRQRVVFEIPEISSVVGKVFVVGDNSVGQLGFNEDVMEKKRPALLEMPHSIVDIAAGGMHSVCLTQTGEVITYGCNDEGALGREAEDGTEYIPRKVDIPEKIVQISAGDSHTAALSESGQVYIWGNFRNNNGVMGLTTPDMKQTLPVKILNGVKIVKIASGSDHLSCLTSEGIVYTCGNGEAGQLGRVSEHTSGNGGRRGISLLLNPDMVHIRQSGGQVHITDVWTASLATFLKLNNGIIYAFGLNNFGQLGKNPDERVIWKPQQVATFKNKIWTQINGGQHHVLALDNQGLVHSLGRSEYGRLGLGEDCEAVSKPTAIPSLNEKKCTNISCGNCVSFALEDNGSVYSWGFGTNYQLGHGNENDQCIPKIIEGNFGNSWKALKISGGGQHALILAHPRNSTEEIQ